MDVGHFGKSLVKIRILLVCSSFVADGGNNIVEVGWSKSCTSDLSKGGFCVTYSPMHGLVTISTYLNGETKPIDFICSYFWEP